MPTEFENGYVAGYEEHRRTVIAAMRNQEAVESIGQFLQTRLQDEYDLYLGNDHALDMASDLLFALVTAIRLEEQEVDGD